MSEYIWQKVQHKDTSTQNNRGVCPSAPAALLFSSEHISQSVFSAFSVVRPWQGSPGQGRRECAGFPGSEQRAYTGTRQGTCVWYPPEAAVDRFSPEGYSVERRIMWKVKRWLVTKWTIQISLYVTHVLRIYLYLNVSDERHGDSFFELVQRSVQVQDLHYLWFKQHNQWSESGCNQQIRTVGKWSADLLSGEAAAQGADGLSVLARLLLHLQQLSSLDDGLQSGCSITLIQVVCSQPFLHLSDVVPKHIYRYCP